MSEGVFRPATDQVVLLKQHPQPAGGDAGAGLLRELVAEATGSPDIEGLSQRPRRRLHRLFQRG